MTTEIPLGVPHELPSGIAVRSARRLECVRPGFYGVADDRYAPYVIAVDTPKHEPSRGKTGARVLDSGFRLLPKQTEVRGGEADWGQGYYTGTSEAYFSVLPPDASLFVLPTTQYVVDHPQMIDAIIDGLDISIVRLHGGEDLSPWARGIMPDAHTAQAAEEFGGYNEPRDQVEVALMRNILGRTDIFPYFTCRGTELLIAEITGIFPGEVPRHHWPHEGQKDFVFHPIRCVLPEGIRQQIPPLPPEMEANSYHHEGHTVAQLFSHANELAQTGWHIAYVDGTEGLVDEDRAVEMMIRLSKESAVTGIATQLHPERWFNGSGKLYGEWLNKVWSQRFS